MFNWLAEITGFEADTILYYFFVLVIISVAFVLLTIWMKSSNPIAKFTRKRGMRLKIKEYMQVDNQRYLVLVQRDNVEHLILIGGNNDILIEKSIEEPQYFDFESEDQGGDIKRQEGKLSQSNMSASKESDHATLDNKSTVVSNQTNLETPKSEFTTGNSKVVAEESQPSENDPYKTVETEMNKLLGGINQKNNI